MIMKDFNKSQGHHMAQWAETGATRTLTWIARIHSHDYINTVTTTWCEAPAQLLHNLESHFYYIIILEGGGANRSTRDFR